MVALATATLPQIPACLVAARVQQSAPGRISIVAPGFEAVLEVTAVHVHRDVGGAFYAAIAPRPAPPAKRLFWRIVLLLARSRAGLALLSALRR